MLNKSYLRQALLASGLLHCLLIAGAGWLGGSLFSKEIETEMIEMELISSVAVSEPAAAEPAAVPQPVQSPQSPQSTQPVVRQPQVVRPVAVSEVVTESVLSVMPSAEPAGGDDSQAAAPVLAGAGTGNAAQSAPRRLVAPRILNKVEPTYPEDARQDGFTGSVGVKIEVMENGRTGDVQLQRSSGRSSLDEAALAAVRKWRFVPAEEVDTGRAVRCYTTVSVLFKLN